METAQSAPAPLLELHGVVKHFGGTTALGGVDFDLRQGEIHALLGENGAGKSTLIKILGGIHLPDAGMIRLDGKPTPIRKVADADRLGIRIIHQELSLAPNLSVAENIYLGREPRHWGVPGLLDRRKMAAEAQALLARLGMNEIRSLRQPVDRLSIAHQQLVEIARALSAQARILVLDEPTSSLSEAETEALFTTLKRLRDQGVGIIYISHRLEEIIRLADRITVLRDGKSIGTQSASGVNQRNLIRWMVGRDLTEHYPRPTRRPGTPALEVRDLKNSRVHGVSFVLRYGEILGLAGLVGSGRTELGRAICGIERLDSGEMTLDGERLKIASVRQAISRGMGYLTEDRKDQGLFPRMSIRDNCVAPSLREFAGTLGWMNEGRIRRHAEEIRARFNIVAPSTSQLAGRLSGGNQQKVLLSMWMGILTQSGANGSARPRGLIHGKRQLASPRLLIVDEPTRGVDIGARSEIYALLRDLAATGVGILMISSDLQEILGLADRVLVMRGGRIVAQLPREAATEENIIAAATGVQFGPELTAEGRLDGECLT